MGQQASSGWEPVEPSKPPEGWTRVPSTGALLPSSSVGPSINDPDAPDTILGGMLRRGKETIKGVGQAIAHPSTIPKGFVAGEKEAAGQVAEQAKGAASAFSVGDPIAGGLRTLQTGVTAASMANPFALGSVTNVNKLSGQKRYREALGQGAFDAITLLAGKKIGEEPTPIKSTNKLSFASDAQPRDIAHVLPELKETAARLGKPETVGDLGTHIQSTLGKLDQQFNSALFRNAHRQVDTTPISNELLSKAANMPPSLEGQAMAAQLRNAAAEYQRPWTLRDLNAERMMRNGFLKGFYGKAESGQMAALRSSADSIIDKVVADGTKNLLYDELDRLHPGGGFRELKQKQSSLIDIKDAFDKHLDKIEKQSAQSKGAPLGAKQHVTASVHPGGVTPRLHNLIPGRDPLSAASSATRSAYGPSAAHSAARAGILSMPVGALVSSGGTGMPPPPSDPDQQ